MRAEFEKLVACVEKHRELILKTERHIFRHLAKKARKTEQYTSPISQLRVAK